MPIKLAFSTVACPELTIDEVATRAVEWGYAGVELRTLGEGSTAIASDPALSDPDRVRTALEKQNIEPVCLSTSIALHHRGTTEAHHAVRGAIRMADLAASLGCTFVRLFGNQVSPGESRFAVLQRIAHRLPEIVEHAASKGVQVVMENAGSFSGAKDWWRMFDIADHPMLGLVWNVVNAASIDEHPSVSVPMLNSRIRLAKVKDTHIGEGAGFCQIGDGDCHVERFVRRLCGIGFDGYITVEWDRVWLPALEPAEDILPEAAVRLKDWLGDIHESQADPKAWAKKKAAEWKEQYG